MGKDKYSNNPLYQKAIYYQQQVKSLNRELAIIDEALAEIQVERISDEIRNETKTTPLWEKWFNITKSVILKSILQFLHNMELKEEFL